MAAAWRSNLLLFVLSLVVSTSASDCLERLCLLNGLISVEQDVKLCSLGGCCYVFSNVYCLFFTFSSLVWYFL